MAEKYEYDFEDIIFKDVFNKQDNFQKLLEFVSYLLDRKIENLKIIDSNFMDENEDTFSIHLLMDADSIAVWLIFAFGDKRNYLKENFYCQSDSGLKLYDIPAAIRYNIKKICDEFNNKDAYITKEYGFILDIFKELLNLPIEE